jgi:uncharacterized protein YndB with AHSA1/START domain
MNLVRNVRGAVCAGVTTLALTHATAWCQTAEPAATPTQKSTLMTMKQDLANRSREIHWPEGFDPAQADLFSHNEIRIAASCERVWSHIIDATKWPQWYPNSKEVRIQSAGNTLAAGSVFRWTTFGLPLESRVNEFVPYSRIGWYGYAPGANPSFYHTWFLKPDGDGCLAVTDEVGKGKDAAHLRQTDESLMHRGHDLWLATLKWVSEGS